MLIMQYIVTRDTYIVKPDASAVLEMYCPGGEGVGWTHLSPLKTCVCPSACVSGTKLDISP